MQRFVLDRTEQPAVAFTGERIDFEACRIGPLLFTITGFRVTAPRAGYVLHVREKSPVHEHADVWWQESAEVYGEAFRRALLVAHTFQAATAAASRGVPVFN